MESVVKQYQLCGAQSQIQNNSTPKGYVERSSNRPSIYD